MKRKFLFVLTSVLFLAVTPFISASEINSHEMAVEQELSFTEVEVSEVPAAVIEAAKKEFPGTEVKKAMVADVSGEKIYKIEVKDADGNKDSGLYNSNGESFIPEVEKVE
jgi:uncharacterized membrane protein YkoI